MKPSPSRLSVETLEGRDCPAAQITANLFNGILTVEGTNGDNTIIINPAGLSITAAGQSFNAAAISKIVVSGLDGNDTIVNNTSKDSVLYGGAGNDALYGGYGNDTLYGGSGNDVLAGRAGNDVMWGGGGADYIVDTQGVNSINQGDPPAARQNTAIEAEIVRLVNVQRATYGLAALTVGGQLNVAADLHSQDMVAVGNLYGPTQGMQHTLYGTTRPEVSDRLDAAGYDDWTRSFAYGENIAYGYASAQDVVTAWMNSRGHRANILSATFREIGVSVRTDAAGRMFFTQDFGYQA